MKQKTKKKIVRVKEVNKNGKYLPTTAWIALSKDNSVAYQNVYPLIYIQKTKPTVMFKDVRYRVVKINLSKLTNLNPINL